MQGQLNKVYKKFHRVYYYETDKMGRVYHSNYLKWMEETRTEFLRSKNIRYKDLEEKGIFLPVTEVGIKYLRPVEYDENIMIKLSIVELNRIKVKFLYEFYDEMGKMKYGEAFSVNVFSDENGKLKRTDMKIIEALK